RPYGALTCASGDPEWQCIRGKALGVDRPGGGTGEFVERTTRKGRRRVFYGGNRDPECDFPTPHKPLAEPCPKCGAAFIVEKRGKLGTVRACLKEDCDWEVEAPDTQPTDTTISAQS